MSGRKNWHRATLLKVRERGERDTGTLNVKEENWHMAKLLNVRERRGRERERVTH